MQENKVKISDLMNNRFDVYFHLPFFYNEMKLLRKSPFKIYKLSELCTQITDGTHYTPNYVDNGIKFISVKNIKENIIDFNDTKFISYDEHKNFIKRCKPEPNDILLTKIGTIGNVCIVPENAPEFSIFVSVALLKLQKNIISPFYMQAVLSTVFVKSQIKRELKGIGVPDLHLENICNIQIPVPNSIEEQNIIAGMLQNAYTQKQEKETKAQKLVEEINDIVLAALNINIPKIENKKEYKTTFSSIFNNRLDPKYHEPQYEELNKILENHPDCINLLKTFNNDGLIKGYLPKEKEKNGTINYLQIRNVQLDGTIDIKELANAEQGIYKDSQKLKKNDIIIVATGATIGKIGLWNEEQDCYLGGDMYKFQTNSDFEPYYILAYLLTPLGQLQIKRSITGATNGHLSLFDIENIKIIKPAASIQKEISNEYINRLSQAKELINKANKEFEEVKNKVEKIILGEESL